MLAAAALESPLAEAEAAPDAVAVAVCCTLTVTLIDPNPPPEPPPPQVSQPRVGEPTVTLGGVTCMPGTMIWCVVGRLQQLVQLVGHAAAPPAAARPASALRTARRE